jgi:large subunit ribosomal protein L31
MSCGGTKAEYVVDVWSGNHPFYQGNKNTMVLDDGRVSRFNKMYADLSDTLGNVATIKNTAAPTEAAEGAATKAPPAAPAKAATKAKAAKK